ncbi:MAG: hydrogenase nickel incorporation protein HypB, partial [Erysipelotrichaceae bacterium]|nr:hydrogenase nickel incorporation protein HypB [Erysipelotrichaceae bacterium]
MYRIIETKERITADNDLEASRVRKYLKDRNVYMINLMGSPGSGKTSTLLRVIAALKDKYNIGVMEADVDGAVDADKIHKAGVRVIQLHSGGLCHMDADMTFRGIESFDVEGIDLLVLENIGNLVCPAEFDTGAHKNIMLFSVPEGDDKPLKYP